MTRLIIVCEGPTEHEFCMDVIAPALYRSDICVEAPLIKRSQGGIVAWDPIKRQLMMHLHESDAYVTLLIDYYGIKDSFGFPGWEESKAIPDKRSRMHFLFRKMEDEMPPDIRERFIPYIQLHEFESLIFSDINVISQNFDDNEATMYLLEAAVTDFPNPEEINCRPDLAPSKRLLKAISGYNKVIYGACLAHDIGLKKILDKCPLFSEWYNRLSSIGKETDEDN